MCVVVGNLELPLNLYGIHHRGKMLEYIKCMSAGMTVRECAKNVYMLRFLASQNIMCMQLEDKNFFE